MKRSSVVLLVLVAIALSVLPGCGSQSPQAVFAKFVRDIGFGEQNISPSVIKEQLVAEKQSESEYDFKYWVEKADEYVGDGVKITDTKIDGDVALVRYESKALGGRVFTAVLQKEDGVWKIFDAVRLNEQIEEDLN